jgi:peptidyl-prolyl cis-trans isomerase D
MLSNFRRISTNPIFRVIISLIILSFIIWGVGDLIKGGSNDYIISVDNKYLVSNLDFQRAKKNYMENFKNNFGINLTDEQFKKFHLEEEIVNQLIDLKLLEALKDDLKLEVSDNIVISQIHENQSFFDENQKFNKDFFSKLLESNSLTETQLGNFVKNEKAKEFITNSIATDNLYPLAIKDVLSQYLNEKRTVSFAYISPENIKLNTPDIKDLENLYKEKQELFVIPEFRQLSYIEISADSIYPNVKISDGEIKEEYKNYIAENYTLEKRDIYNLIIKDKEKADEALKLLKAGNDFVKVVEKYSTRSLEKVLMKNITKSDLPAELQNETFELNKNDYSKIIATNYGYHLIKVIEIHQVSHPKYEIIKENLYKNLMKRKSEELIYDYIKDIEDSIASGSKDIKDLAKELNLTVTTIEPITYDGSNTKLEKVSLPKIPNLLTVLFSKKVKDLELIEDPLSSRYYIVSIDKIVEKRYKDFAEAKNEVTKLWTENELEVQSKKLAALIIHNIKQNNTSLVEEGGKLGLTTLTNKIVYRDLPKNEGFILDLPQDLLNNILSIKKREVSNAYKINDRYILGEVNTITFEKSFNHANEEKVNKSLHSQYNYNYIEDLLHYLRNNHTIKVNKNL